MYCVLCIEDSLACQKIVEASLQGHSKLHFASSLAEAKGLISKVKFDLVILDINLPDGDGLKFCAELKSDHSTSEIPVILVTSHDQIEDKAVGFQLGIEDYIVKPYDPKELKLRVTARLKKISGQKSKKDQMKIGYLNLDFSNHVVTLEKPGKPPKSLKMSVTELRLLKELVSFPETIKSRQQLLESIWENNLDVSDRAIDSHMSRLRKKIKGSGCDIEAVPKLGYRFILLGSLKKAS